MKKIFYLSLILFQFTFLYSQTIPINRSCDTFPVDKINSEKVEESKVFCLTLKDQQVYFTSKKEFDAFYKEGNSGNSNCGQSGLNNFDFDKYNVLLINYATSGCETPIFRSEIFYDSGIYCFYFKLGIRGECSALNYVSRYFLLPKEKSNQLPKINICYYDAH